MSDASNGPPICSQCGKAQAYVVVNGAPMCAQCHHTVELTHWMKMSHAIAMLNHADAEMAAVVGMPHLRNPVQMPKPPAPPITYSNQNVTVNGGSVGVINSGHVGDIRVNLKAVHQNGQADIANSLSELTKAIINADDADTGLKNELLEQIADLSAQAAAPAGERKPGRIKALFGAVHDGATAITSAAGAWGAVEPLLRGHFGL